MQRGRADLKQTAKRSVTRLSDKPTEQTKENELDPNAQLEKRTFTFQRQENNLRAAIEVEKRRGASHAGALAKPPARLNMI